MRDIETKKAALAAFFYGSGSASRHAAPKVQSIPIKLVGLS
jgi:hypothetical protein